MFPEDGRAGLGSALSREAPLANTEAAQNDTTRSDYIGNIAVTSEGVALPSQQEQVFTEAMQESESPAVAFEQLSREDIISTANALDHVMLPGMGAGGTDVQIGRAKCPAGKDGQDPLKDAIFKMKLANGFGSEITQEHAPVIKAVLSHEGIASKLQVLERGSREEKIFKERQQNYLLESKSSETLSQSNQKSLTNEKEKPVPSDVATKKEVLSVEKPNNQPVTAKKLVEQGAATPQTDTVPHKVDNEAFTQKQRAMAEAGQIHTEADAATRRENVFKAKSQSDEGFSPNAVAIAEGIKVKAAVDSGNDLAPSGFIAFEQAITLAHGEHREKSEEVPIAANVTYLAPVTEKLEQEIKGERNEDRGTPDDFLDRVDEIDNSNGAVSEVGLATDDMIEPHEVERLAKDSADEKALLEERVPGVSAKEMGESPITSDFTEFIQEVKQELAKTPTQDLREVVFAIWQPAMETQVPGYSEIDRFADDATPRLMVAPTMLTQQLLAFPLETAHTGSDQDAEGPGTESSRSDEVFARLVQQMELVDAPAEMRDEGVELVEAMYGARQEIQLAAQTLQLEIAQLAEEHPLPEIFFDSMELGEPLDLQQLVEVMTAAPEEELPENIKELQQALLEKIALLQKISERFSELFIVAYDPIDHELRVQAAGSAAAHPYDPMRERLFGIAAVGGDVSRAFVNDLRGLIARTAIRRSDFMLAA